MMRWLLSAIHVACLSLLVVPPQLVVGAAASAAPTVEPVVASQAVERIERAFVALAGSAGLRPMGSAQVQPLGDGAGGHALLAVTTAAGVPLEERTTSDFFWRRTTVVRLTDAGAAEVVAESDLRAAFAAPRVTLTFSDRFSEALDRLEGRTTELAGIEVRRVVEFDSANLEALAAAQRAMGGAAGAMQGRQADLGSALEAAGYRETATIIAADGTERTYAAGEIDANRLLGSGAGGGAELTVGCVSQCFSDAGGAIGLATALCLVAGLVVCTGACAISAGIACLPCIGGAGTICGVAIAAGSLGVCIAVCINPDYVPPPPTPTPVVGYSLSSSPLAAAVGASVSVRWTAPGGHDTTDWIGLFREGADNADHLDARNLSAATSGSVTFQSPAPPGRYEFRLLLAGGVTEPSPPRRSSLVAGTYSLSVEHTTVGVSQPLAAHWTAPPEHSSRDWIGLYSFGEGAVGYEAFRYLTGETAGTSMFTSPEVPGNYVMVVLLEDGFTEPVPNARVSVEVVRCPLGDCDGGGRVTIDELTRMVALRLGQPGGAACGAEETSAGEIATAVIYGLSGCGAGRPCDGELSCEGHEFCNRVDPECSIPAPAGACRERPRACSLVFDPVCGCDGVTYSNECSRQLAGATLRSAGACF